MFKIKERKIRLFPRSIYLRMCMCERGLCSGGGYGSACARPEREAGAARGVRVRESGASVPACEWRAGERWSSGVWLFRLFREMGLDAGSV